MVGGFSTILLGLLAVALLIAAVIDLRERRIPNLLNLAIAALAVPFWWSLGLEPWPDMAIQAGVAAFVFALFCIPFAFGAMGGGDVKMLGAIALWLPALAVVQLLIVTSLAGGALTLFLAVRHRIKRSEHQLEIPYGVAIAFAGICMIGEPILNQFGR